MDTGELKVVLTVELLRESLPDGLTLARLALVIGVGFCICLPERVCAVGLYSSELSAESDIAESTVDPRRIEDSEATLFRFLLAVPLLGADTSTPVTEVTCGDARSPVCDFLGPRLIPGLPRPRPLPDTTDPSWRTYCLFLRDPLLLTNAAVAFEVAAGALLCPLTMTIEVSGDAALLAERGGRLILETGVE